MQILHHIADMPLSVTSKQMLIKKICQEEKTTTRSHQESMRSTGYIVNNLIKLDDTSHPSSLPSLSLSFMNLELILIWRNIIILDGH